ncbi:indole-3-glycerol phosphate synthase TrpC [Clostridium paridis]|uniref:Indole-3-glycerol phosphate synthase n=1 Tax=Clostridium paridis TaxID=2803863 RepID=A0A937FIC7_9CLOT|nr:indole-3-glycerol phosphate synthase TrpC [Clostridium paridis]MBL4932867.1 indole-3-glycerol phosphate synthase TrpC [Clostridium paridis]
MHNILMEIISKKKEDLKLLNRDQIHEKAVKLKDRKGASLRECLLKSSSIGVISEIKKASPSKGNLNLDLNVEETAKLYEESGALGVSVLTEERYFKGSYNDLEKARKVLTVPILNKDFFVDKIQIDLCKIYGGDVILLILKALTQEEAKEMLEYAHYMNLEVLMEVHDEEELFRAKELKPDIIGVNNRNLETFNVALDTTIGLSKYMEEGELIISESGIKTREDVEKLKSHGIKGILVGETFVTSRNLKETFKELKL